MLKETVLICLRLWNLDLTVKQYLEIEKASRRLLRKGSRASGGWCGSVLRRVHCLCCLREQGLAFALQPIAFSKCFIMINQGGDPRFLHFFHLKLIERSGKLELQPRNQLQNADFKASRSAAGRRRCGATAGRLRSGSGPGGLVAEGRAPLARGS